MKKKQEKIFNILTIAISIIALFFSYFSYQLSIQSFEYEKIRDTFIYTPTIIEKVDSVFVQFKSSSENSELQSLSITFPSEINTQKIRMIKKPIQISNYTLEGIAEKYIEDKLRLKRKDSVEMVGNINIPVVFDYSCVVFGSSQYLRESRMLIFDIHYYENTKSIKFNSSFLIDRLGYPLKKRTFYTGPFSKPLDIKIAIQDSIDLQELLRNQLRAKAKMKN
ncbi:hypothetical protein CGC56_00710 [Capnocytophaga canimorsus]|uniref:Uncharacterized protein n=1 Tax=Capnocytophaga canimorsus TaxID=28188 RepID=A0A250G0G9_9FLAO|nr:hypothetical protein [Capnocytophaga canimorsus]ATA90824.1 hypothetical protein CGC56_00710 [Capnocytophaga canimorsus]